MVKNYDDYIDVCMKLYHDLFKAWMPAEMLLFCNTLWIRFVEERGED